MKKKLLAMFLAVGMVAGVTGCGNNSEKETSSVQESDTEIAVKTEETTLETDEEPVVKEPVTITYWYNNGAGEQQYTEQVEEKLNEILKGLEGYEYISIDLKPLSGYKKNFALAQAANEKIDLVSTYGLDFITNVQNGDFIALDDLLAQFPDVVSEVPEWLTEMGKVYGEQYYIPTYQQATSTYFWQFPQKYLTTYLKAKDITKDDLRNQIQQGSTEDILKIMEDYILTIRENTGKENLLISGTWTKGAEFNKDYIDADYGSLILREGSETPEWYELSEEYKVMLQYKAKWYQEGLLHPDVATIKEANYRGENYLNDGAIINAIPEGVTSEEMLNETNSQNIGIMVEHIQLVDHYYIPSRYAAGGNAIYADCEHPEEAMMIIELLMTKKGEEFYNTLVWGLEGIHYEWVDKDAGKIKTLEYSGSQGGSTSTYHAWKWNVGNTFNAWANQAVGDGTNDFIESVHESPDTVLSPAMGITWDLSPVADQIAQCNALTKEYSYLSIITSDDWEARYNEYVEKLKIAGVEEIVAYATKLYNDYKAAK